MTRLKRPEIGKIIQNIIQLRGIEGKGAGQTERGRREERGKSTDESHTTHSHGNFDFRVRIANKSIRKRSR
jgi:hypothetical protein